VQIVRFIFSKISFGILFDLVLSNIVTKMTHLKLLLLFVFIFTTHIHSFSQSKIEGYTAPASIGKTFTVESTFLKENRKINIYLPRSYSEDSLQNYPIIYVLDGASKEDFTHVAGIVQYGSASWINIVPESIVIGLPNSHKNRDFVAKKNEKYTHSGGSKNFMNFIEFELIPYIDKNYRATEHRTIIGHTLGGLFVSEVLVKRPHVFTNFVMLSPTLSWDHSAILKEDPKLCLSKKTIFIGAGKEARLHDLSTKKFYLKFKALNVASIVLHYKMFADLNKTDIMYTGTYHAFSTIFKPDVKKS